MKPTKAETLEQVIETQRQHIELLEDTVYTLVANYKALESKLDKLSRLIG